MTEGYKLVSVEPDLGMKLAGRTATGSADTAHDCWSRMIAAAPEPLGVASEGVERLDPAVLKRLEAEIASFDVWAVYKGVSTTERRRYRQQASDLRSVLALIDTGRGHKEVVMASQGTTPSPSADTGAAT